MKGGIHMYTDMKYSEENYPPHLPQDLPDDGAAGEGREDVITLPDGRRVAPNGDLIGDPSAAVPEILPDHEYTPEKEDLNLLIM